jgi:hypothetical protein
MRNRILDARMKEWTRHQLWERKSPRRRSFTGALWDESRKVALEHLWREPWKDLVQDSPSGAPLTTFRE